MIWLPCRGAASLGRIMYNRDPNIKALNRRRFTNHGSGLVIP